MSKSYIVEAQFSAYSNWEVPYNLEEVCDWYIKYNTLYIKVTKDDKYIEYEVIGEGDVDYKYPNKVWVADSDEQDYKVVEE